MKVIRNGTGWDISFDMVFTDKTTASTIARRIAPLLSTLIRDAVDASMCEHLVAAQDSQANVPAAGFEVEAPNLHSHAPKESIDVAPIVYPIISIAARVRAMGLLACSGAD